MLQQVGQSQDEAFMRQAILLGERGRITAPPNPWVGCLIVKEGRVVGEGYHLRAGEAHAEVNALQQAGLHAKGSTIYLTLEPCCHYGKTPPCSKALISACPARVVVAQEDPDSRMKGKGIQELRSAGIPVEVGVGAEAAQKSLLPYLFQRERGCPYTLLKAACSIDGRVAAHDGSSRWISSREARADVHLMRVESQAILIGAGTAVKDNPTLIAKDLPFPPPRQPLRVLLDAKGRVHPDGPLFDVALAPTLIFSSHHCPPSRLQEWRNKGCEVWVASTDQQGRIDLHEVMRELGARKILQLLVEGGSEIFSQFIQKKLVQRLLLYVGPRIIGSQGIPLFADTPWISLKDSPELNLLSSLVLGDSVRLDYELV